MAEVFYLVSLIAVICAVMVLLSREIVHSALFLAVVFIIQAGYYIMLGAEFLAMVQVLVYIGGVITMILFTIMLTKSEKDPEVVYAPFSGKALVFSIFAGLVITTFSTIKIANQADAINVYSLAEIGQEMFTTYVLPFELISLVLLVAMVAAIYIAKPQEGVN